MCLHVPSDHVALRLTLSAPTLVTDMRGMLPPSELSRFELRARLRAGGWAYATVENRLDVVSRRMRRHGSASYYTALLHDRISEVPALSHSSQDGYYDCHVAMLNLGPGIPLTYIPASGRDAEFYDELYDFFTGKSSTDPRGVAGPPRQPAAAANAKAPAKAPPLPIQRLAMGRRSDLDLPRIPLAPAPAPPPEPPTDSGGDGGPSGGVEPTAPPPPEPPTNTGGDMGADGGAGLPGGVPPEPEPPSGGGGADGRGGEGSSGVEGGGLPKNPPDHQPPPTGDVEPGASTGGGEEPGGGGGSGSDKSDEDSSSSSSGSRRSRRSRRGPPAGRWKIVATRWVVGPSDERQVALNVVLPELLKAVTKYPDCSWQEQVRYCLDDLPDGLRYFGSGLPYSSKGAIKSALVNFYRAEFQPEG